MVQCQGTLLIRRWAPGNGQEVWVAQPNDLKCIHRLIEITVIYSTQPQVTESRS